MGCGSDAIVIQPLSKDDFDHILTHLDAFWGERQTDVRLLHHPMFLYEFGDYGFVIREDGDVVAYLLGFILPEKHLGYIHFIGVRATHRKQGLARKLYEYFMDLAKQKNCRRVKAITTANNRGSIAFHRALGFELMGDVGPDGIPVVKDYKGPGEDRVVFVHDC